MSHEIYIPHKTFELYTSGYRTFIHLPKTDLQGIDTAIPGEDVVLVDRETREELQQQFMILYNFKEIERFVFVIFYYEIKSLIFRKRARIALDYLNRFSVTSTRSKSVYMSNAMQTILVSQMAACSSFLFIEENGYLDPLTEFEICNQYGESNHSTPPCIPINDLCIKKDITKEKCWHVWSMVNFNQALL